MFFHSSSHEDDYNYDTSICRDVIEIHNTLKSYHRTKNETSKQFSEVINAARNYDSSDVRY